ncbi:MAG: hypothetical protein K2X76_13565, partial [Sphingomonas sp.]|nr:hypothetical protein [Sphingomonas sp.]
VVSLNHRSVCLGIPSDSFNYRKTLSYVATDISAADAARLAPQFTRGQNGSGSISNGTAVISLTATF